MQYEGTNLGKHSYSYSFLGTNVSVGNYSSIASDCIFHAGDNHLCVDNRKTVYTTNWEMETEYKPITIGNDVWIGRGVRVLEDTTIGNGAIIGAGSVIAKSVPPYAVIVGNPQRITRFRFTTDQIEALERIKWWEWDESLAKERIEDMKNIDTFIQKYDSNRG